jgi:single-stranded-DNA-specific exonuclease
MRGLAEAVDRILRARPTGETVAVYGDYDVDGVTSTTLLVECLRALDISVIPFLPRREVEGYGLNASAIDYLRARGVSLLVAVDCGISGAPEVAHARELGMDVVVVDHHHAPAVLPDAAAVVNPRQDGCAYPFKDLCGVGLAYKLARALLDRTRGDGDAADRWLDLVALGTIADVVPLLGENRVLVARGLPVLDRLERPGLRALALQAGTGPGKITPRAVGFVLAPRLNAAGRLADAGASLRLLLTTSADEARHLAETLEATNRERQRLTELALGHARDQVHRREAERGLLPKLLLAIGDDYRNGVVGLVASKLVEEFCRPALVAERKDGVVRGSARSVEGFHVTDALGRCQDLLDRYGGHALAAGFTVQVANLDAFRSRLEAIAAELIDDAALQPTLKIDAQLRLRRYDSSLPDLLRPLDPTGAANPPPVFLSRGLRLLDRRLIGSTPPYHLKLALGDGPTRWEAVGWGMGDRLAHLPDYLDAVYAVERNTWNGREETRLRLLDLHASNPIT